MHEKDLEATGTSPAKAHSLGQTSNYDDPSSTIWSVYVSEAGPYDKTLVEGWTADMDGILIFSGLFSASVTAFIVESYKTLSPSTGDSAHTVLLLVQISQQLATISNGSQTDALLPFQPFQPTSSALRVNAFWFLSLCFGLACALAATLVQQWARYYLQAIERRPVPHKKARIRAFLYNGIESFGMKPVVEGIPTLMHIAVFLFFAGLVDFLCAINRFVAYATLGIVAICAGLYVFITFLPTIHRHCPYRTPLSGICWRILQFMGMLRYRDWNGDRKDIEGSMEQGREMLATQDLPGRDERDQEALSWTMESLTDNMELEPFVEGISPFLSDGSHRTSCMMRELVINKDIALMDRIAKLLMTCKEPGALAEDRRRKRVLACLAAITSLARVINVMACTSHWSTWLFGEGLAETLRAFELDETMESSAKSTMKAVASAVQCDIISAIASTSEPQGIRVSKDGTLILTSNPPGGKYQCHRPDDLNKGKLVKVSTGALQRALRVLYILDSLEAIIGRIPDLLLNNPNSPLIPPLLSYCRFPCVPRLLLTCKDNGILQERERRKRALLCMKATYFMAPYEVCHTVTASAVRDLTQDKASDVAYYANCTAFRLACHIQFEVANQIQQLSLSDTTSRSISLYDKGAKFSEHDIGWRSCIALLGHCQKLDVLNVLHTLEDTIDKGYLRQGLRLGLDADGSWCGTDAIQYRLDQLEQWVGHLPPNELRRLQDLDLRASHGRPFPLKLKMSLNAGHVIVLIAFLHLIATSPLPTLDGLDSTHETLSFIAGNLSARFASGQVQAILAQMVYKCTNKLRVYFADGDPSLDTSVDGDRIKRILCIIDICFDVLGTVGAPDVITDAKRIIDNYMALEPTCLSAAEARRKLEVGKPLIPVD